MKAYVRILDGGRAGGRFPLRPGQQSVVGRDPSVDIPLDPTLDLAVSAQHARISFLEGRWEIRDMGSRNGTYVNGKKISRPIPLDDGDEIRFGTDGPRARFDTGESGTDRMLRQSTHRTRRIVTASLLLLVVGGTAALFLVQRERSERAAWLDERATLHATVDSLLEREEAFSGVLEELDQALTDSREEVSRLQEAFRAGEGTTGTDEAELARLQGELEAATQALARQQLAAGLDFAAIETANRPAVVLVYVEATDGRVVSGTGFATHDDALIVTARHLLEDEGGTLAPARIAVQFSDSRQVWPAEVVEVSTTVDLALLRAGPIEGGVPRVRGLASSGPTQSGVPVAILGFPLGGSVQPPGSGQERPPALPLLSAGVVSEIGNRTFEVQGYGEPGASGSPVLDGDGRVVGVVQGGTRTERGGVLTVISVDEVADLILRSGAEVP